MSEEDAEEKVLHPMKVFLPQMKALESVTGTAEGQKEGHVVKIVNGQMKLEGQIWERTDRHQH